MRVTLLIKWIKHDKLGYIRVMMMEWVIHKEKHGTIFYKGITMDEVLWQSQYVEVVVK